MKVYHKVDELPTDAQLDIIETQLEVCKTELEKFKIDLSNEERQSRRKMGDHRLAYASEAERNATEHEEIMPRSFEPSDFAILMSRYRRLASVNVKLESVQQAVSNTLMALGIDAMTFTKIVHDAIRSANGVKPGFGDALDRLDDYNHRAQTEVDDEVNEQPTDNATTPVGSVPSTDDVPRT